MKHHKHNRYRLADTSAYVSAVDRNLPKDRYRAEITGYTTSENAQIKLLRRPEVEALTGLSRSTIYDWMSRKEFPQPVKLGARLVAWREADIVGWLESRQTRGA